MVDYPRNIDTNIRLINENEILKICRQDSAEIGFHKQYPNFNMLIQFIKENDNYSFIAKYYSNGSLNENLANFQRIISSDVKFLLIPKDIILISDQLNVLRLRHVLLDETGSIVLCGLSNLENVTDELKIRFLQNIRELIDALNQNRELCDLKLFNSREEFASFIEEIFNLLDNITAENVNRLIEELKWKLVNKLKDIEIEYPEQLAELEK